jgi:uncharacterized protein (TIGR02118 family)
VGDTAVCDIRVPTPRSLKAETFVLPIQSSIFVQHIFQVSLLTVRYSLLVLTACRYLEQTTQNITMSNQGTQVIVLYPRKDGSKFDLDYYHATHMPLVKDTWTQHGLKSFSIVQLAPDNQYSMAAILDFENQEGLGKAMGDPATKKVMDDIVNFSSEQPVIVAGNVTLRG